MGAGTGTQTTPKPNTTKPARTRDKGIAANVEMVFQPTLFSVTLHSAEIALLCHGLFSFFFFLSK